MVADASQLLRQIRHFKTVSWKMFCSVSCVPHAFLSTSAFFPLNKSAARPCGLTYSLAADPAQTWHQYWGRICQLPQGRRGPEVGGTELQSSQGTRGVYYKLHILSKQNGISWNRQTDIYCLDFYHLQAVHTKSRTLNQVWDNMKDRAKAGQSSKSKSFKKVQKKVRASEKWGQQLIQNKATHFHRKKQPIFIDSQKHVKVVLF